MGYLIYPSWLARLLQRMAVRGSRMGRMLRRRGVGIAEYTRSRPFIEIEGQLARCARCPYKGTCDRMFASRARGRQRYAFCPNARFVDAFLE